MFVQGKASNARSRRSLGIITGVSFAVNNTAHDPKQHDVDWLFAHQQSKVHSSVFSLGFTQRRKGLLFVSFKVLYLDGLCFYGPAFFVILLSNIKHITDVETEGSPSHNVPWGR